MFWKSKYFKLFFTVLFYLKYYLRARKLLRNNNLFERKDIEEYQYHRLKELIQHAYTHVPYYKEAFDRVGFHPDQFNTINDIESIPVLDKEIVRANTEKLIAKNFSKKYLKHTSSGGTTGVPLSFYLDSRTSSPNEMAYLQDIWKEAGFKLYDKVVVLRSESFEKEAKKGKFWRMNYAINWLSMSTYDLTADNFQKYYNKIQRFKPKFIIAYPSVVKTLVDFLKDRNLNLPSSLKAIICSSESIYESHKKYIQDYLKVPVTTYYGLSEKCCIARQIFNSECYQFYPQYGYVELLDTNNNVVRSAGSSGEITATGLNNFAFPFIRYKTSDIGILSDGCKNSDREWLSLSKIEGRVQDYFIDKYGNRLPFAYADEPMWCIHPRLHSYQYLQEKPGHVVVHLVSKARITEKDLENVRKSFYHGYRDLELEIKFVDHIKRTKSGKFRYLIQKIKS